MSNPFWEQAKRAMANTKPIKKVIDKLPPLPTIQKKKKFKDIDNYHFEETRGHVEVFKDGKFQFSADTMQEARQIFYNEDF